MSAEPTCLISQCAKNVKLVCCRGPPQLRDRIAQGEEIPPPIVSIMARSFDRDSSRQEFCYGAQACRVPPLVIHLPCVSSMAMRVAERASLHSPSAVSGTGLGPDSTP